MTKMSLPVSICIQIKKYVIKKTNKADIGTGFNVVVVCLVAVVLIIVHD